MNNFLTFQHVIETLGSRLALQLMSELGGTKVYVPKNPKPGQQIVRVIGVEGARKLADLHGGEWLIVPTGKYLEVKEKHRLVREASAHPGASQNKLARQFGLTERQVRRIQAEDPSCRHDPRQLDIVDMINSFDEHPES